MVFFFFDDDLTARSSSEPDCPESPLSIFDGARELPVEVGVRELVVEAAAKGAGVDGFNDDSDGVGCKVPLDGG